MLECVWRGGPTRTLECRCPSGVQLYQCHAPDVESAECALMADGQVRAQAVRDSGAATCLHCPHRIAPVVLPRKQIERNGTKSLAEQLWEQHRAKRALRERTGRVAVVLDCDHNGFGDATVAAWLAEGHKDREDTVLLHATGERAQYLRMLGQSPLEHVTANQQGLMVTFAADKGFHGNPPRMHAWCATYGLEPIFARPPYVPPPDAFPDVSPDVLLFPESEHTNREWPPVYWHQLAEELRGCGLSVVVAGKRNSNLPATSFTMLAPVVRRSRLVVANDSGPAHMAGTLGVPTIAILGPTTDGVFAHMPEVRCVAAERRIVQCVGCWFNWGYDKDHCLQGCTALSNVLPELVLGLARSILEEVAGGAVNR